MIAVASDVRRSAIPKLVISESGSFPELAVFYLAEVIGPGLQQLTAVVRRGIKTGEFRRVDPELAARSIIAPLVMAVIWRHTFARHDSRPFDSEALIGSIATFFCTAWSRLAQPARTAEKEVMTMNESAPSLFCWRSSPAAPAAARPERLAGLCRGGILLYSAARDRPDHFAQRPARR